MLRQAAASSRVPAAEAAAAASGFRTLEKRNGRSRLRDPECLRGIVRPLPRTIPPTGSGSVAPLETHPRLVRFE